MACVAACAERVPKLLIRGLQSAARLPLRVMLSEPTNPIRRPRFRDLPAALLVGKDAHPSPPHARVEACADPQTPPRARLTLACALRASAWPAQRPGQEPPTARNPNNQGQYDPSPLTDSNRRPLPYHDVAASYGCRAMPIFPMDVVLLASGAAGCRRSDAG